jgi:NhaP-type Na+/H+ or K+/H+ antiporter
MAEHGTAVGSWTLAWLAVDVAWKIAAGIVVGLLVGQALGLLIFRYVEHTRLPESGTTWSSSTLCCLPTA